MAEGLSTGDLVTHRSRGEDLFIVVGYMYRISVSGDRKLIKLICGRTGELEHIVEEQLILITSANKKMNISE